MGKFATPMLGLAFWCLWVVASGAVYMKYKDPKQPLNARINDLMSRMTLEEKVGQMGQMERGFATAALLKKYFIGSVLSGGGSIPAPKASAETWVHMVNELQRGALATRLGIPMIYGIDAIHGHNNVYKATIFPHNVGLGVTRQVYLPTTNYEFCCSGKIFGYKNWYRTHADFLSGIPNLLRGLALRLLLKFVQQGSLILLLLVLRSHQVCRDPRWGRCYESYSEDHKIVQAMTEIIPGLQGDIPANSQKGVPFVSGKTKVAACAKHFVGDGGTVKGINENNTVIDFSGLLSIHMPAYFNSIQKGVATIMVSYSSWNGKRMHANGDLITGFLKDKLKFRGFVISDWQGIDQITDPPHANYSYSVQAGIHAGIDMVMLPVNFTEFIDDLIFQVKNNIIPMSRIDDAVRRILRVKFVMGLFENPLADLSLVNQLGSQEHRELAREAVRKSLVLLKNSKNAARPLLPLSKKAPKILVAGTHADNLGCQCGGWTIAWQGLNGNDLTVGTTILTAVRNAVDPSTHVVYNENPDAEFLKSNKFSYAIVVVGEPPYSETNGDSMTLTIAEPGVSTISNVCGAVKCVVVIISGRPVVIEPHVPKMDALVAAWLPGTEGQGVADILFGDYGFTGKLARTWFKTVDQLPMNVELTRYKLRVAKMRRLEIPMMRFFVFLCFWAAVTEAVYMKYKDPKQPLNARIKDLMNRMTLEEKVGQMTQIERKLASPDVMKKYFIGSILSGGGSVPAPKASAESWINTVNELQRGALSTRLGIPMIYGIDAVHGHNNAYKATIFPHNVGLGVTRQRNLDPNLLKRIGAATALEVRATGIPYAFAPCIAVCRDPRWGRCYESYSEDHKIVQAMTEIIPGLQGDLPANSRKGIPFVAGKTKVAACAKHFVGDGGTVKGIDENNTVIDFNGLLSIHMPAYLDSIRKGVSTVMVSYSSWNGKKMHASHDLVTGFLKDKLKFRGFVISDWQGIDKITDPPHTNYSYSVQAGIQAGIDMIMLPENFTEFVDELTFQCKKNIIPMSRIDDAVKRILRVKFVLGLFENPIADLSLVNQLGSQEHRELAREAVRKSLVLLKNGIDNRPLLPLPKKDTKILVAGSHADNLGYQCGGWTIEWQGLGGNDLTIGTTVLTAVRNTVDPSTQVVYNENPDANFVKSNKFSYAIVVVGEHPYTETFGDSMNLTIAEPGTSTISNVCGAVKCVVVIISGRPVVIEPYVASIDALVAAWLPGTEAQGIADLLFGDYGFSGKLARTWFRTVDQLPMNVGDAHYDPLYPFGFGLTTKGTMEN
ncbi:hypothetical protein RJ639_029909 [Escallonia herrerae]|uniref:beta-glucosidase n=1 Tax=Escallonia herrerae TaxID=1293975 RepID=A0AA88WYF7_9ASTE|nr:hypothetical protein RJ639_029909 [Escallonia herrerae]